MTTKMEQDSGVALDRLRHLEPMASLSPVRLAELATLSYIEKLGVGVCVFRVGDVDNQTLYLLDGDVQLTATDGDERVISARSDAARFPLDDKQPRQLTAVTLSQVELLRVDNSVLDYMLTWDQLTVPEPAPPGVDEDGAGNASPGTRPGTGTGANTRRALGVEEGATVYDPAHKVAPPAVTAVAGTPASAERHPGTATAAAPEAGSFAPGVPAASAVTAFPVRDTPYRGSGRETPPSEASFATSSSTSPPRRDWVARMRHIMSLKNLPPANVKALLGRMEKIPVSAGEVVVREGERGDYYYVLTEGRARVSRNVDLAELEAGATFGEEALIADALRNATVTMITEGSLMRLSKDDFNELMREPLIHWLSAEQARVCTEQDALWLDVRHANEYAHQHLSGAINLPLHELRARASELDKARHYICYCKTGRRSSAAAFLLSQQGFKASVLRGGLQVLPLKPKGG